jgi:signal transduction histidine kinase/ActR/RegA family two-component response regulator
VGSPAQDTRLSRDGAGAPSPSTGGGAGAPGEPAAPGESRAPGEPSELLSRENEALKREVKRLERALEKEHTLLIRYRSNNEAKKQFADIVLAERTRLELQMNLLLQNSRDFILFFDAEHQLILCTESLLRALGIPGIGLIKGKDFRGIFTDRVPAEVVRAVKSFVTEDTRGEFQESFTAQFVADLRCNGDNRDYLLEVSLMRDSAGVHQGWLFFFYDNTDLVQARREAENANTAKSEFLAKISHDIRSPMNAVIGLAKMLSATSLDSRQRDLLNKIESSSDGLLALINDLLDFSKIEAGKLDIIDECFDFRVFLDELSSVFEMLLKQKELALHTHFASDLPEVVCTDAKRLRQILTNLVNNAYKYTPSGWIDFSASRVEDGSIRLDVCDTGIGIREDELSRLFTAFEQLDVKRNRDITGTGLGLAITKQLTELMGGSVEVQSTYGEGSVFSVILPLKTGTRAELLHDSAVLREFTAPRARVLIVDDVAVNTEIAEFMLEDFKVQVEKAVDGRQALGMVQKEHFDLILMDHMMPIMDGVEATRHIRELDGPASKVPIIAMTANAVSGVVEMFLAAGFDGYISKPMDAALLSAVLYDHLPKELIQE